MMTIQMTWTGSEVCTNLESFCGISSRFVECKEGRETLHWILIFQPCEASDLSTLLDLFVRVEKILLWILKDMWTSSFS